MSYLYSEICCRVPHQRDLPFITDRGTKHGAARYHSTQDARVVFVLRTEEGKHDGIECASRGERGLHAFHRCKTHTLHLHPVRSGNSRSSARTRTSCTRTSMSSAPYTPSSEYEYEYGTGATPHTMYDGTLTPWTGSVLLLRRSVHVVQCLIPCSVPDDEKGRP